MRRIEVKIEKIAFGGAGFGHFQGKACFIPYTAPGDLVIARITKEKSSYLEAELVELLVPSEERGPALCEVFGECGGCSLQHLNYESQLSIKEGIFTDQLWRFARVEREVISPVLAAEYPWGYRTRVQIKVRLVGDQLKMGFYRSGSHYIVPFPGACAVASPVINRLIPELSGLLPTVPEPDKIPQVDISVGDDGESIVIVHYTGKLSEAFSRFLEDCFSARRLSASGLWLQHGRKNTLRKIGGVERLTYRITPYAGGGSDHDYRLAFSRGGFSQVNFPQNRKLVSLVCEFAQLTGQERVLDIFCGNGNITIPLAMHALEVVGIEEYEPSVDDARSNAAECGLLNVSFITADAVAGVTELIANHEKFDLVVLDPPRTGAASVMRLIPELRPTRVVYISCDPMTFARDIAILRKFDYCIVRSVPLDMFPQTCHIESVSLLVR